MVVICTRCATQFQFDESRLPLDGAKVRCSRCAEAFFLAHPKAMPESEADLSEEGLFSECESESKSPREAPMKESSESEVEAADVSLEDDLKWDFDFNAQSELHGTPEDAIVPVASGMEDRSRSASRSVSRGGEQAVFASAADLADWLADRTDTLEPEPPPERVHDIPESTSSPSSVRSAAVPLGMMVKKPLNAPRSPEQASHASGLLSSEQKRSAAARGADPSIEGLLADLLRMPQGQVPDWFRSGIRSAVQVLGWAITLSLVTTGLIKGLGLAF